MGRRLAEATTDLRIAAELFCSYLISFSKNTALRTCLSPFHRSSIITPCCLLLQQRQIFFLTDIQLLDSNYAFKNLIFYHATLTACSLHLLKVLPLNSCASSCVCIHSVQQKSRNPPNTCMP